MKYLSEEQIAELEAEQFAREVQEEASALVEHARQAGFLLTVHHVVASMCVAVVHRIPGSVHERVAA